MKLSVWDKIKLLHLDEYVTKQNVGYIIDEFAFTSKGYDIENGDIIPISDFLRDIPSNIKNKFLNVKPDINVSIKAGISMILMCEYLDYSLIIFKNNPLTYFLCRYDTNDVDLRILPKIHPEYFCLPKCTIFKTKEDVIDTPYSVVLNKDFQQSVLDLLD